MDAVATQKIKKSADAMGLSLRRNPDILATMRGENPGLYIVGFAAETEQLEAHARSKLSKKKLDLIAANLVGNGKAFDRDDNQLSVYWDGGARELAPAHKSELADQLAQLIADRYLATTSSVTA
jgi:phosphopantothenoylcysteine decarboxylase/phosphopantothenate--cysteine ligase